MAETVLQAGTRGHVDFGGGSTDVVPWCVEHRGFAVNAVIILVVLAMWLPMRTFGESSLKSTRFENEWAQISLSSDASVTAWVERGSGGNQLRSDTPSKLGWIRQGGKQHAASSLLSSGDQL